MPTADEVLNEVTREHLSKFRSTAGLSYALATRCAAAESRLAEVESERDNWIDDARRYATNAAHHERERDTLRAASADWQWNYEEQVKLVAKLRAEVEDYKRAHETVMNERCAPDEMHCTCVPILRAEVERMKQRLSWWDELHACASHDFEMDRYDELLRLLGLSSGPA